MTLILGSGRGLGSLLEWQSDSGCVPELLRLDVVLVPSLSSGIHDRESSRVTFLFQRSHSLWLSQALRTMSSAWLLISWSVSKADSEFLLMYGVAGEDGGVVREIRSTTPQAPTCSSENPVR